MPVSLGFLAFFQHHVAPLSCSSHQNPTQFLIYIMRNHRTLKHLLLWHKALAGISSSVLLATNWEKSVLSSMSAGIDKSLHGTLLQNPLWGNSTTSASSVLCCVGAHRPTRYKWPAPKDLYPKQVHSLASCVKYRKHNIGQGQGRLPEDKTKLQQALMSV